MKIERASSLVGVLALLLTVQPSVLFAQNVPLQGTPVQNSQDLPGKQGLVARNESVEQVIVALAQRMGQSAVVSAKAKRRRLSGVFDLDRTGSRQLLDEIAQQLGLVWYTDGRFLHVYEASEATSAVGNLQHASVATLTEFLAKTRLADERYAVRAGSGGTFYVSGPSVYVDIVMRAARYLDALYAESDSVATHVEVIKLQNSFVNGRRYTQRDEKTNLPGVADAIRSVFGDSVEGGVRVVSPPPSTSQADAAALAGDGDALPPPLSENSAKGDNSGVQPALVIPYAETNSLLVRGTRSQIMQIKSLVAAIDVPREQVELALWIIDIKKTQLDQLGVRWQGQVGLAGRLGVSLNTGNASTLDGQQFLAAVSALEESGDAWITSRPALLTQENVEARFDSNQSFYASLVGERVSSLEKVTYGTSINVLPRVSASNEVEMQLQIEDGSSSGSEEVDGLPTVARTQIDTVARVPQGLSLLVGGYSRSSSEFYRQGIPGLRRVPFIGGMFRGRDRRQDSVARLYLIQPRVLKAADVGEGDATLRRFGRELDPELERVANDLRTLETVL